MNQFKVILIVLGLLLTGFGAGFLTHRAMVGKQMENVRALGRGAGFGQHLLENIEATTEQKERLHPILKQYGRRMGDMTQETRQRRRTLIDSMHQEIKPMLNDDQIKRLDEITARFQKRKDQNGPRRKRNRPAEGKKGPADGSNE